MFIIAILKKKNQGNKMKLPSLTKNWKGALIGPAIAFGSMFLLFKMGLTDIGTLILAPGVLVGGLIFKIFVTLGWMQSGDGFFDLAQVLGIGMFVNLIFYSFIGAYIQGRKK